MWPVPVALQWRGMKFYEDAVAESNRISAGTHSQPQVQGWVWARSIPSLWTLFSSVLNFSFILIRAGFFHHHQMTPSCCLRFTIDHSTQPICCYKWVSTSTHSRIIQTFLIGQEGHKVKISRKPIIKSWEIKATWKIAISWERDCLYTMPCCLCHVIPQPLPKRIPKDFTN